MNITKTALFSFLSLIITISASAQTFKEPVSFKLKNGMNIIVSENNHSPKAYASFTLNNNAFTDKKDGIVELLNAVLNESVARNSSLSFKDNSGKLAASFTDFDKELSAMAFLIQNADIDQKTFNMAKAKLLTSIKMQDYDYDQTVNEVSISALTLADIKDFYNQITPEKTYLTIAGNVELNAAKAAVKKTFGTWGSDHKQEIALTAK